MDDWYELEDSPPDEAYGRVTNPERFQAVVDAARALIDELVERYHVSATAQPGEGGDIVEAVALAPDSGLALSIHFSDLPGVILRATPEYELWLPTCGCDACDEQPEDLIEMLTSRVRSIVAGDVEVTIARRHLSWAFKALGLVEGHSLKRGRWRELGVLGTTRAEPWGRRGYRTGSCSQ